MKPTKPGYFDREECRPFYPRGGDNGILLVHGFTGSAAHMRPLADELARRGHPVRRVEDYTDTMGHAGAIRIDPQTGVLQGGTDPRGDGLACGY